MSATPPCILRTGGHFGSDTLDSAPEQTDKTLEQTDDTTICDTLLDHRCDCRGEDSVSQIIHSDLSGMSMTSAMVRVSDSLRSEGTECTSEYCSTAFSLIGVSEENGMNLSGRVLTDSLKRHAYIKGVRIYTRLFIR